MMCKKQEDFISVLEGIADMEMKTITKKDKKPAKKSVNLVEPVEKMKERFQNLDKAEREKLLEGSRIMYEDSVGAANLNQTLTALIISVVAAIFSSASLAVSAQNIMSANAECITIVSMIFIWITVFMAFYSLNKGCWRSKVADNYRNACLALIALSDNDKDKESEE